MHDDETRISGMPNQQPNREPDHRSGWTESDTVAGIRDHGDRPRNGSTPPGGWNSANGGWPGRAPYASGAPYGYQSGATAAPAKKGGPGWLAPLVIVLAALVLVAGAFYFMRGRDQSGTATPTVNGSSSTQPTAASAPASTSNDPVAPLPAGHRTCIDPKGTIASSQAVLVGQTVLSCAFANDVVNTVLSTVQSNPQDGQFTLASIYSRLAKQSYTFTCNRLNHVSACSTRGRKGEQLQIDVQDNVSS